MGLLDTLPRIDNPGDFAAAYGDAAKRAGEALGVSPHVILGQWGLETGWGRSIIPGTNNLGNIKDFSGGGVGATDNANGSRDQYRAYKTPDDFASDYVGLVRRKYPGAMNAGSNPSQFAAGLQGYAEDPRYADKIIGASRTAANAPGPALNAFGKAVNALVPAARAQQPNNQRGPAMPQDAFDPEWAALAQRHTTTAVGADPQRSFGPRDSGGAEADPWESLNAQFSQPKPTAQPRAAGRTSPQEAQNGSGGLMRILSSATPAGALVNAAKGAGPERNLVKGGASGFADVGNTILNGASYAADAVGLGVKDPSQSALGRLGIKPPLSTNVDRQDSLNDFNKQNEGLPFGVGRVGGNILATLPVGGVLGAGFKSAAALPGLARVAPALEAIGSSVGSGGMRTGLAPVTLAGRAGNMGLRMAGSAANFGAGAGLVDPSAAGAGLVLGAVAPPLVVGAVKGMSAAAQGVRSLLRPEDVRAAKTILEAGGFKTPEQLAEVRAALSQQGPNIVAEGPTVPQILQNPGISQLQRTLRNSGDTTILGREAAQDEARFAALDRISPVAGTVHQAAENFGEVLAPQVRAADSAARINVERAFGAVDPTQTTRFNIPIPQMEAAQQRYLGPGTFGSGNRSQTAIDTARDIGTARQPAAIGEFSSSDIGSRGRPAANAAPAGATVAQPVPFVELQNLRSSIGEAHAEAQLKGRTREAAALDEMRRAIDGRVEAVAAGRAEPGESFPAEVVGRWREALALHQDRMQRFHTGPQTSIFRQGGDGLPAAQGAELAPKFFNPRGSQNADAVAFQRIATPETTGSLKNYAVTDAASQTDRLGRLNNAKFSNWINARSGAVDGLFTGAERAQLFGVGSDLARADAATALGLATGSNTAQNAQSALGLGLLDNKVVSALANRIPGVGRFTGPLLDGIKSAAKKGKVERLGGLLANPEELDKALALYLRDQAYQPRGLLSPDAGGLLLRAAPAGLLGSGQQ